MLKWVWIFLKCLPCSGLIQWARGDVGRVPRLWVSASGERLLQGLSPSACRAPRRWLYRSPPLPRVLSFFLSASSNVCVAFFKIDIRESLRGKNTRLRIVNVSPQAVLPLTTSSGWSDSEPSPGLNPLAAPLTSRVCCFVLLTRYWGNRGPSVIP